MKRPEVLEKQCAEIRAKNLGVAVVSTAAWSERHYRVEELAGDLGVSRETITKMFEHEPGVWDASENPKGQRDRRRRRHRMLMIPDSVVRRVLKARQTAAA
jgi:hypothetical protein